MFGRSHIKILGTVVLTVVLVAVLAALPARAAGPQSAPSLLPPLAVPTPGENSHDQVNVVVFGDSLGGGIWEGLYWELKSDPRFRVTKVSHPATGLVRDDYFDWNEAAREVAGAQRIDVAIVLIGTNDRQPIVEDGKRHGLRGPSWEALYGARIDRFIATLKGAGARVYWVGLPVMRSTWFGADMQYFNGIYERKARENNVVFVPTWDAMAGPDGGYAAYGEDLQGRVRQLRKDDGVHFTASGYRVLAAHVAQAIARPGEGVALRVQVASSSAPRSSLGRQVDIAAIGLKAQIYDGPQVRPGRSDDWRWPRR